MSIRPGIAAITTVAVAILFAAAVRVRIADVPLERDEGEYAYAGQLVLQGIPPYELAYNMKFPGTYFAYAVILAIFGESARGIHLGLLLVNAATTVLVFLLGRRLFGPLAGTIAACAFALLSLDRWILGVFAHATHFVILPVVGALLVLSSAVESRRPWKLFAGGVLLGVATMMKQHALFFIPLGAGIVLQGVLRRQPGERRAAFVRAGWVLAGAATPLLLLVPLFAALGVLDRFWFWTFRYASEYVTQIPVSAAPGEFLTGLRRVTPATQPIWIAGLAGAVALALRRGLGEARVILAGLLVASLLALSPGFYFREHYFILLLPATALLVGLAADSTATWLTRWIPGRAAMLLTMTLCGALAASYIVGERAYLFTASARDVSRQRYGSNPFVEAVEIARYIRERTTPGERIAVLGSEPEIYFYAGRRSATGYIYTYPLMEPQAFASAMQREMREQIERAHPTYLVLVQLNISWLVGPWSDRGLLEWAKRYVSECYALVGVADIHSDDVTSYAWGADAASYARKSTNLILTYRRKSDAPCGASR